MATICMSQRTAMRENLRKGAAVSREKVARMLESDRAPVVVGGPIMTTVNVPRSHLASAAVLLGLGVLLLFWAPWSARANTALQTSNVAVNCEARQQAVVRQTVANGELQVNIQCVNSTMQPASYVDEYGRPLSGSGVGMVPAVYAPQPVAYASQPVAAAPVAPRTVVRQAPRTISTAPRPAGRSWQKTALVIGGSAGAGAGVGGLVGGKKGALIGAAIGGGSATLFEAIKRK
jgi:hypothetical protein